LRAAKHANQANKAVIGNEGTSLTMAHIMRLTGDVPMLIPWMVYGHYRAKIEGLFALQSHFLAERIRFARICESNAFQSRRPDREHADGRRIRSMHRIAQH
jgi:hypothetical protein